MPETDPELEKYEEDSRTPCKYGVKCYQKNAAHLSKYKHPPQAKRKVNNKKNTVSNLSVASSIIMQSQDPQKRSN
jgi:hypothetical protein